mmetsp:Transcript_30934/g.72541  ORF Transcript_30934/g.72541 Transcript_30934/m.72541 type:complete len:259 (+) Transcript_30934:3020-3796(+)
MMPLGGRQNIVSVRIAVLIAREFHEPTSRGRRDQDDVCNEVQTLRDNGFLQSNAVVQPRAPHQHIGAGCLQGLHAGQEGVFPSRGCSGELEDFAVLNHKAERFCPRDRLAAGEVRECIPCVPEECKLPVGKTILEGHDMLVDAGRIICRRNHNAKLVSPARHPEVNQPVLRRSSAAAMNQRLLNVVLPHRVVNSHVKLLEGVDKHVNESRISIVEVNHFLRGFIWCGTRVDKDEFYLQNQAVLCHDASLRVDLVTPPF